MIHVHASSYECEFDLDFVIGFFHVPGYCYALYIVYRSYRLTCITMIYKLQIMKAVLRFNFAFRK
jgi:hypothetical protein